MAPAADGLVRVSVGNTTLLLSPDRTRLLALQIANTTIPLGQSWCVYSARGSSGTRHQAAGAYILRPTGGPSACVALASSSSASATPFTVVTVSNDIAVIEQRVNSFITQRITVYGDVDTAQLPVDIEYWIDAVPIDDGVGKEVIMRLDTNATRLAESAPQLFSSINIATATRGWYVDSNGRGRSHIIPREKSDFPVPSPWTEGDSGATTARAFHPVTSHAILRFAPPPAAGQPRHVELGVFPDRSTAVGLHVDGSWDFLLHRRLLEDDGRGVGEPLNETSHVEPYVNCDARQWASAPATKARALPAASCGSRSGGGLRVHGVLRLAATTIPAESLASSWWVLAAEDVLNPIEPLMAVSPTALARLPACNGNGARSSTTSPNVSIASIAPRLSGDNSSGSGAAGLTGWRIRISNNVVCDTPRSVTSGNTIARFQALRWLAQNPSVVSDEAAACLNHSRAVLRLVDVFDGLMRTQLEATVARPLCARAGCEAATEAVPLLSASCLCFLPRSLTFSQDWRAAVNSTADVLGRLGVAFDPSGDAEDGSDTIIVEAGEVRSFEVFGQ
jgi:hypothetical protein